MKKLPNKRHIINHSYFLGICSFTKRSRFSKVIVHIKIPIIKLKKDHNKETKIVHGFCKLIPKPNKANNIVPKKEIIKGFWFANEIED